MAAFEISINGEPLEVMESPGMGTLSAHITWIRVKQMTGSIYEDASLLRIGGASDGATQKWPKVTLNIGDEIRIRIVNGEGSD